jgi:hypothetical protein
MEVYRDCVYAVIGVEISTSNAREFVVCFKVELCTVYSIALFIIILRSIII